ncbi:MAG: PEP-CTERM sorting domain-containing protein [Anaerohalosphaeraceae bacterium]
MKALSGLFMFLAAAVCVQGAFYLDASVPLEGLQAGDTIEIKMMGEMNQATPVEGYLVVWGPGSINGGHIVYPGGGEYQDAPAGIFDPQNMPDDYAWWMLGSVSPEVHSPYSGVLIDQIMFTCGGQGAVTVALIDGLSFDVIDSIQIPQIPEPCTLTLLGLGAAAMLLRKQRC